MPLFAASPDRLSAAVGVESLPYGDLLHELSGGIYELHWNQEEEAFFDRGNHVSDGELVDEVLVRCKKGAGFPVTGFVVGNTV